MMKNVTVWVIIFGLILLLQLACSSQRTPVTCSQVQENELRALLKSSSVTLAKALEWLHNSAFKDVEITGASLSDSTKEGRWSKEGGPWYSANFRDDMLIRVDVSWESFNHVALEPTGNEIISCFGRPDFYLAGSYPGLDGKSVTLSLWYVEEGVVVFSKQLYYKEKIPLINGNVIMSNMSLITPNTIEATVNQVYTYGFSNDDRATVLKLLKPWPDSWDNIVIDSIKVGE